MLKLSEKAENWLNQYRKAVKAKHGDKLDRIILHESNFLPNPGESYALDVHVLLNAPKISFQIESELSELAQEIAAQVSPDFRIAQEHILPLITVQTVAEWEKPLTEYADVTRRVPVHQISF